jgi:hypothetical protein
VARGQGLVRLGAYSGGLSRSRIANYQLIGVDGSSLLTLESGFTAAKQKEVVNVTMTYVNVQLNGQHTFVWKNSSLTQGRLVVDDSKYGYQQHIAFSGVNTITGSTFDLARYPSFWVEPDRASGDTTASLLLYGVSATITPSSIFEVRSGATLTVGQTMFTIREGSEVLPTARAITVRDGGVLRIQQTFICYNTLYVDGGLVSIFVQGDVKLQYLTTTPNTTHTITATGVSSPSQPVIVDKDLTFTNKTIYQVNVVNDASVNYGFKQIIVNGNAVIAGTLNIVFPAGLTPSQIPNNDYELFKVLGKL